MIADGSKIEKVYRLHSLLEPSENFFKTILVVSIFCKETGLFNKINKYIFCFLLFLSLCTKGDNNETPKYTHTC